MKIKRINNSNVQLITREEWDIVTPEQKEQNAKKHNRQTRGTNPCQFCGQTISDKSLDKSWWVHMSVDGDLFPMTVEATDDVGSQGFFPIGASCAKRVSKEYKTKRGEKK